MSYAKLGLAALTGVAAAYGMRGKRTLGEKKAAALTAEAVKVNPNWEVEYHEPDVQSYGKFVGRDLALVEDSPYELLYEYAVYDLSGEGEYVEWFQQYAGTPNWDSAEKGVREFLRRRRESLHD